MILTLCQAHGVKGELVSLERQLQTAGGVHPSPGHDLALVKSAQPSLQRFNHVFAGWFCWFV